MARLLTEAELAVLAPEGFRSSITSVTPMGADTLLVINNDKQMFIAEDEDVLGILALFTTSEDDEKIYGLNPAPELNTTIKGDLDLNSKPNEAQIKQAVMGEINLNNIQNHPQLATTAGRAFMQMIDKVSSASMDYDPDGASPDQLDHNDKCIRDFGWVSCLDTNLRAHFTYILKRNRSMFLKMMAVSVFEQGITVRNGSASIPNKICALSTVAAGPIQIVPSWALKAIMLEDPWGLSAIVRNGVVLDKKWIGWYALKGKPSTCVKDGKHLTQTQKKDFALYMYSDISILMGCSVLFWMANLGSIRESNINVIYPKWWSPVVGLGFFRSSGDLTSYLSDKRIPAAYRTQDQFATAKAVFSKKSSLATTTTEFAKLKNLTPLHSEWKGGKRV